MSANYTIHFHVHPITLLVSLDHISVRRKTDSCRNVGPFRYWTVSNLPLFLLASPVLYLMITNSYRTIASLLQNSCRNGRETFACNLAFHLAVPELLLSLLALTSYHVQIITRISSGYVLWYFGLARSISEAPKAQASKYGVRLIILYALVQAALFSAFLPPA